MNEKFALIIPTYNEFAYVAKCLESMVAHCSDYLCILIEDGSPEWDERWLDVFRKIVPPERFYFERFAQNKGVTATWNHGLQLARKFNNQYAIIVNADTLFSPGTLLRTEDALEKLDLMGPLSNAAGGNRRQQIEKLCPYYKVDDSDRALTKLSRRLRKEFGGQVSPGLINGFWLAAKTKIWWDNSFSAECVFDPGNRIVGNEDEFQARFKGKIGSALDVFIFHYRSVSRRLENVDPDACIGSFRLSDRAAGSENLLEKMIPSEAKKILVMGGREKLQAHPNWTMASIEELEKTGDTQIPAETFDCVVLADALERTPLPGPLLANAALKVRRGGFVLASFSNAGSHEMVRSLVFADYLPSIKTKSGGMEGAPLHLFARQNIEELFEYANLRIQKWKREYGKRNSTMPRFPFSKELQATRYHVIAQKS